jgi:hypothetical protein
MDLAFDCRVCKKNTAHKLVNVTDKLPANVHVLECIACGVLGVRSLSDEVAHD